MVAQMKLELAITANAKGVSPATAEARREIHSIGEEAKVTAAELGSFSTAQQQAWQWCTKMTEASRGQAAAERDLRASVASFSNVRSPLNDNDYKARSADIEAYGSSLDALRAKYNPLFAASKQYERELTDLNAAERLGAISSAEHGAELERLNARYAALAGRSTAGMVGIGNAARLTSFQLLNLSRQGNDVITMWALGAPAMQIFASQAGQIYDALESGPKGVRGSLTAIRSSILSASTAFIGFLGPIGLVTTGLIAAGAAVAAYAYLTRDKVRSVDELLKDHADILKSIADLYVDIGEKAKAAFSGDTTAGLRLQSASTQNGLKIQIANQTQGILSKLGYEGGFDAEQYHVYDDFAPFADAIEHLRQTAAKGSPDILGFRKLIEDRWALDPNNAALTKSAGELLDLVKIANDAAAALARLGIIQDKLAGSKGPGGLPLRGGMLSTESMGSLSQYNSAQAVQQARAQAAYDAEIQSIRARSPDQKAAAARAQASSTYNDNESAAARAQRIELAGTKALIAAQHELTEAQRQRLRSLDETIASAQLDLALVGKSDAVAAGLRMQHQLLAQVRAAADDAGIKADQGEIDRIRQKSAEYARLQALQSAREMLLSQGDDLERSRLEISLIGQNSTVRDRLIAQLQTEQEIRRRGIDQYSTEAQLIRANTLEMAANEAQIRRQGAAWDEIASASENAIDTMVDSAANGFKDIGDAGKKLGADLTKMALDMSLANPIKNWLTGSELPTFSDVGQMGGYLGKLFGRSGDTTNAISSALGSSVGAMNVSAAVVNLSGAGVGGGVDGIFSKLLGGASGSASMANFAKAIRAIESAGSGGYSAIGALTKSGDRAYGAYQVMGANIPDWTKQAVGQSLTPAQFLANNAVQDKVFEQQFGKLLQKYGNSNDAASAWFTGGPLAKNAGKTDILGTTGSAYVDKFNGELGKLGNTADMANKNLSGFGSGLNQVNSLLSQFPAAPPGGGLLSLLGAGVTGASMASISPKAATDILSGVWGAFDGGGWTGHGGKFEPAGVVHKEEFVFSAEATRAIGPRNLDALHKAAKRGFAEGGYAVPGGGYAGGGPSAWGGGSSGGDSVQIFPPAGVETTKRKKKNNKGGFDTQIIQRLVKQDMAEGGYDDVLRSRFGTSPSRAQRGSL